jgi:hypothetical protein
MATEQKRTNFLIGLAAPHQYAAFEHILVCELKDLTESTRQRWSNYNGKPALEEVAADPTKGVIFNCDALAKFGIACMEQMDVLPAELQTKLKEAMQYKKPSVPKYY